MLADAINFGVLLYAGFWALALFTFLVTIIEWILFRCFDIKMKSLFWLIFRANLISTVVGAIAYLFQPFAVHALGLATMVDYSRNYYWAEPLVILGYFVLSVLTEGLVIARQPVAATTGRSRSRLWRVTLWANVASYLVIGPYFYLTARPDFDSVQFVDRPADVVQPSADVVYFLSPGNNHLWRIRPDGTDRQEVLSAAMTDYLISADQTAVVFIDRDDHLFYSPLANPQPTRIGDVKIHEMTEADLSPDKNWLAVRSGQTVQVYDLVKNNLAAQVSINADDWESFLTWSSQVQPPLLYCFSYKADIAWELVQDRQFVPTDIKANSVLLGNYRHVDTNRRIVTGIDMRLQKQGNWVLVIGHKFFLAGISFHLYESSE